MTTLLSLSGNSPSIPLQLGYLSWSTAFACRGIHYIHCCTNLDDNQICCGHWGAVTAKRTYHCLVGGWLELCFSISDGISLHTNLGGCHLHSNATSHLICAIPGVCSIHMHRSLYVTIINDIPANKRLTDCPTCCMTPPRNAPVMTQDRVCITGPRAFSGLYTRANPLSLQVLL